MKLDYIYVINLNTDNSIIHNKVKDIPLHYPTSYYICPAVNGWNVKTNSKKKPANWWKIDSEYKFWNREVTPGEIGCTLSHYNIIKQAYFEGFENILILEEDFVSLGLFPTQAELDSIPKNSSIVYLDRNAMNPDAEVRLNEYITKVDYTYNTHALIYTRKGMKEILDSPILDNIIAMDEFLSAINGTSGREDAVKVFHNKKFRAYALNGGYFKQTSNANTNSLTEFNPTLIKKEILLTPSLLDVSDWNDWCNKYIHPMVRKGEYALLVDEPIVNCYEFPFFTKEFCDEIILLAETKEWTKNRHEFYPTTDNLLEVLGIGEIYTRLINEFIRPLAIWAYGLEGTSWDVLRDESFIIRYRADEQSHLSLHHDFSNLTTLVNLNPGEFEGGGTYFPKYKALSNPKQIGTMTLHPGNITHKHGARPVLSGTRYVIVSFIKSANHK